MLATLRAAAAVIAIEPLQRWLPYFLHRASASFSLPTVTAEMACLPLLPPTMQRGQTPRYQFA